jgi:hypothetical protein
VKTTEPAPLSPLAHEVYRKLVQHLRANHESITYGELATALEIHPRSSKLHDALGEVTVACRARGLPMLPAMVWRSGAHRPSDGYYKVAHPRTRSFKAQVVAWEQEHARVIGAERTSWPASP